MYFLGKLELLVERAETPELRQRKGRDFLLPASRLKEPLAEQQRSWEPGIVPELSVTRHLV